ncbi:putative nucleoside transporter 3 [Plasmodium gaboni]|uniref:Nucleoside transporter 3, putative n=1 Tax=Plasmodium gaboni TaxID=647221 RepID=A0A151LBI2_9APIC|nr:putative nucleoside transporter 3 [Plasmodium gaboni]KYN96279.1 putative nucleoside transporter 3 [Plasmodium gaboni]SOV19793.1 nucleoside transporter 3, putative [Plasmodium gaboni]SOV25413.1 nucleoside transporter 3, putative [Plasmodium sp. DRC-Itaito]
MSDGKSEDTFHTTLGGLYEKPNKVGDIESFYPYHIEKVDTFEEDRYRNLLCAAYALMAIIADAPYFMIVSMADYFKTTFNVSDIMINEFALMESLILIVVCSLLHLIGSYRLKWNLLMPIFMTIILVILNFVVYFKTDYIGHKIIIFSAIPLGLVSCISKMTTMKICVLFKHAYCSAYVCGLSFSGFIVFIIYVLGAYVFFPNDELKFFKMFTFFCVTICLLALTCFSILYRLYKKTFVRILDEKFKDKGLKINKKIFYDSIKSMKILWPYMLIAYFTSFLTYQIYPSIFPTYMNVSKELKGTLAGFLLFGDSIAHLLVHYRRNQFLKTDFSTLVFCTLFRVFFLPIFLFLPSLHYTNNFSYIMLISFSFLFGLMNGLVNNSIFLKAPETCKEENKYEYIQLTPNILYLCLILGITSGCLLSKVHVRILNLI